MKVDSNALKNIRDNHPEIWEWMKHKANYEHITMGKVLNDYKENVEKLLAQ